MLFEIKSWVTAKVLFSLNCGSMKLCVEAAVEAKTVLSGADLSGADLRGADLRDAVLRDADLRGADLRDADLRDADLSGADLRGADLRDADLSGAPIPKIDQIDAKILEAVNKEGNSLDMGSWHACATTHCRAGWAVTLAGDTGKVLEWCMGTASAAALIYAVSRPGKPTPNFYASNEDAMADIQACAAEQAGVQHV